LGEHADTIGADRVERPAVAVAWVGLQPVVDHHHLTDVDGIR
jgi:hypothetical protein